MSNAGRVLITLCTYNERDNLPPLVAEIHAVAPDADVLVIDDASPDGTGHLADDLAEEHTWLSVLHRAGKLGLGTATIAGFQAAIDRNYEFVLNMDADFSHAPRYIPDLIALMDRADVAIGSRYVKGGGVVGWSFHRHFMSQGINWYARLFLGLPNRDNSGSFRCYRISLLRRLDFGRFIARGYAFQEEVLYRCRQAGGRFAETPIVFEDRKHGQSKINWRESVTALMVIFRLGIDRLSSRFRSRQPLSR